MLLRNGKDWQPTLDDIRVWMTSYPNIDIAAELSKMESWCHCNPQNRKTERGIRRFVNSWLARARPASQTSTRHTSLQEDLTDTSWA